MSAIVVIIRDGHTVPLQGNSEFLSLPVLPQGLSPGQACLVMEVSHQVPRLQRGAEHECSSLPRLLRSLSHASTTLPKEMLP